MKDFVGNDPPERGGLDPTTVAVICTDLAFVGADDERVRTLTGAHFKGQVLCEGGRAECEAIARERKALAARIRKTEAEHSAMSDLVTVMSNEPFCKQHWLKRSFGLLLLVVGLVMLAVIPLVVAAGIYEADLIERVYENPYWGLLYGIAPVGGALALHALKDCLRSDRMRRLFDIAIYGGAVVSMVIWASLFSRTFLVDATAGFGAANVSAVSLSTWYQYHLLLELFAGAGALSAASDLLTAGAKTVSVPNPAKAALGETLSAERDRDRALAAGEDALEAAEAFYEEALAEFQDRCVLHVQSAKHLLATMAAVETQSALAAVRDTLINSIRGGH
ncbi:MAG: hypothetical protein AAFU49_12900 [Pseudomonadota bacterium]